MLDSPHKPGYGVYVKLFTSIFDGSLYGKFEPTVTFIAMLALADEKGVVDMTPEAIAAKSGFPIAIIRQGLQELALPDPRSRTKTEECLGRRILPLDPDRDWGWLITNYVKYRQIRTAEERREYFRQYKAQSRKEQKSTLSTESTKVHRKPPLLESEADTEAYAESLPSNRSIERPTSSLRSSPDSDGLRSEAEGKKRLDALVKPLAAKHRMPQ